MMAKIRALKPEFFTDESVVELQPLARILFQGMWVHACDNGHIEDRPRQLKLRILPADDCDPAALVDEIVEQGMARRVDGWLVIPNLGVHQKIDKRYFLTCDFPGCGDAKPVLTTRREAPPEPHELPPDPQADPPPPHRDHDETTPGAHRGPTVTTERPSTDGDGDGDGDGDTSSSAIADAIPDREDVISLCEHLARRIVDNGGKKPTISKTWKNAARLLLDRDQRDPEEAHRLIDWCQTDTFWMSNILSMPKFREKYDQLRLRAGTAIQPEPADRYEPRQPTPEQQARIDEARARHEQRLRDAETERENELPTTQAERDAAAAKLRKAIGL